MWRRYLACLEYFHKCKEKNSLKQFSASCQTVSVVWKFSCELSTPWCVAVIFSPSLVPVGLGPLIVLFICKVEYRLEVLISLGKFFATVIGGFVATITGACHCLICRNCYTQVDFYFLPGWSSMEQWCCLLSIWCVRDETLFMSSEGLILPFCVFCCSQAGMWIFCFVSSQNVAGLQMCNEQHSSVEDQSFYCVSKRFSFQGALLLWGSHHDWHKNNSFHVAHRAQF